MKWLERTVSALLALSVLAIIFGSTFLPMNDAPSHIANGVIAHKLLAGDSFFAAHYRFDLIPVPYLATVLLMVLGLPVLSPLWTWKLIIGLYAISLPLACHFLSRSVEPPRLSGDDSTDSVAPLLPLSVLAIFHWGYWMGESNYLLGQPVALCALALLIRTERLLSGSFFGFLLLSVVAYLCHIYALTMLLIGATSWAFVALLAHRFSALSSHKLRRHHGIGLAFVYALFAVAAYFVLFQHGSDANRGSLGFDLSPKRLLHMLIDPFDSPEPAPRITIGLLYASVLATWLWAHRDRLRQLTELVRLELLVPGLTLILAAYLGPVSILAADGTQKEGEIAIRFVLGGFLLTMLSLRMPKLIALRSPRALLVGMLLLFAGLQLSGALRLHRSVDAKLQRIEQTLLAKVPAHSRVLPLLDLPEAQWRDYLIHRLGNYVVLRDSYSPHIFAVRGQHPLRHLPWGDQREVANLHVTDEEWRYYDYVLLYQRSRKLDASLASHLTPLGSQDDFHLLQVRRPTATTTPAVQ